MLLTWMSWWQSLSAPEQVFWGIGLIFSLLFIIYLLLQIIGHETDLDLDHGDVDFAFWGLRSLLAFGMFLGYAGVVALRLGLGLWAAILAGGLAGGLAAWLSYLVITTLLRLQSSGTLDVYNAIGQKGSVHLRIPANQQGTGKVFVEVQGALRELDAITKGDEIPTGATITVDQVTPEGVLVVRGVSG
ncbi:MAG: hypothetical protein KBG02_14135 [Haliscomenobacter sp.]|nr:hypothetical protein [Haliscomenobacter sp.]MBP9078002.1 hypothetical protein [Haliscomenobacter sp.]